MMRLQARVSRWLGAVALPRVVARYWGRRRCACHGMGDVAGRAGGFWFTGSAYATGGGVHR